MGRYRIDPETGMPLPDTYSRASTPDLLWENAFPGIDDEPEGYYFGDGPMDMRKGRKRSLSRSNQQAERRLSRHPGQEGHDRRDG